MFALFRSRSGKLKHIERVVLEEFLRHLSEEVARKFRAQIDAVNLVQRHSDGREVCLYVMKGGTVARDPSLRVAHQAKEANLGTLVFRVPGASQEWTVTFTMVEGYLFALDFDPSPRVIWDRDTIERKQVRLGVSPLRSVTAGEAEPEPMSIDELQGWPKEWVGRFEIQDVSKPLPTSVGARKLAELDVCLPQDYAQLLEVCDGLRVDGAAILGFGEAYTVNIGEGRYVVVVDFSGEAALGLDRDGRLFVLSFDEEKAVPAGGSLRAVIEDWLTTRAARKR